MSDQQDWTAERDATLRRMRGQGLPWVRIALVLGVSEITVRKRATQLGLNTGKLTHYASRWRQRQRQRV
jgi:hypothetical protein